MARLDGYPRGQRIRARHARDPIQSLHHTLVGRGIATAEEMDAVDKKVQDSIDLAWEFGEAAPYPPPEEALTDVYVKYP